MSVSQTLFAWLFAVPAVAYIYWVLFGVVAWVQHLGDDARAVGWHEFPKYLPGSGGLEKLDAVDSLVPFLMHNVPLGILFVGQHTFLSINRLERWRVPSCWARLLYSVCSAAVLHFFLVHFKPLRTQLLFVMPIPQLARFCGGMVCLVVAALCMLLEPRTWALLGASQALKLSSTFGTQSLFMLPGGQMDAITWMGKCMHSIFGNLGFVLFSGISIIPYRTNLGDVVVRAVAAFYLRKRSPSFRVWVHQIEQAHLLTWALRAGLFLLAMWNWEGISGHAPAVGGLVSSMDIWGESSLVSSAQELAAVVCIGAGVAVLLRHAESGKP